jgi:hypothetical protein
MPATIINEKTILDELRQLPAARWSEVWTFIRSLQSGVQEATAPGPIVSGPDLAGSDLIGIWADRPDIASGQEFARRLRQQAEQRRRTP